MEALVANVRGWSIGQQVLASLIAFVVLGLPSKAVGRIAVAAARRAYEVTWRGLRKRTSDRRAGTPYYEPGYYEPGDSALTSALQLLPDISDIPHSKSPAPGSREAARDRLVEMGLLFVDQSLPLHGALQPAESSVPTEPSNDNAKIGRVFVSYVREDASVVDLIVRELERHGVHVWLDRRHLDVGDRWKDSIRDAIRQGEYFLACFSPAYSRRYKTYMNEELLVAIEELRLRPRDRKWFLPVTLGPSKIPAHPIGAGETLTDIQQLDLSTDWAFGMARLVRILTER